MQRGKNSHTTLKKNKVGGLTLPDMNIYQGKVFKAVNLQHQDRKINNETKTQEKPTHIYIWIFDL